MDSYMGSGHRSARAKDQAKAFKTHGPSGGFLAPGVPGIIPAIPPPPPAPPTVATASVPAGAAAAGAAVPLGVVAAVTAGGVLGYDVVQDINRFKKNAVLPFYDDAQWQSYDPSKLTRPEDMYYDEAEDAEYVKHLQKIWREWQTGRSKRPGDYWYFPARHPFGYQFFVAPDGFFSPLWLQLSPFGNSYRYYWQTEHCGGAREFWTALTWTGPPPGNAGSGLGVGCGIDLFYGGGTSVAPIWKYNGSHFVVDTQSGHSVGFGQVTKTDAWLLETVPAPGTGPYDGSWVELHPGGFARPQVNPEPYYGHGVPWADAVADPGSQPSYAEQVTGRRLPSTQDYRGFVVGVPRNFPFAIITTAPGSPPVTVPDVIVTTSPRGASVVSVPPTAPPDFPSEEAGRAAKPRMQRFIHAGFVAINVATETYDFLEAMNKALPPSKRAKGKKPLPHDILKAIWNNWEFFDADLAVENFVNNQIEDAIYGRYFGLASRAQRRLGVTAGLARGLRGQNKVVLPVPEIHFANGRHSVSVGDTEVIIGG